tara:strand:+ start:195 stop:464 length:270 start_codon:yes stop_codon:yes gene_type:complete
VKETLHIVTHDFVDPKVCRERRKGIIMIKVVDGRRMKFWVDPTSGKRLCRFLDETPVPTPVVLDEAPVVRARQPIGYWPGVTFKRHDEL